MRLKGLNNFHEKIPVLSGKRIILIPIFALIIGSLFSIAIFYIYSLPYDSNPLSPIFPLLAILIIQIIALLLVYQMWYWRDKLKSKYQQNSYQRIFFIGFVGICIMIAIAFNNFTPIQEINSDLWENPSFSFWVTPFTSLLDINIQYLEIIRYLLSGFLFIFGILTIVSSLLTFGIDYMALVYLYFPEESKIQSFEIYSILRHPTYTGVILISFAGFIYNLSLFNLLYLLINLSGLSIHIILVEEKELIQRFGDSYKKYRNSVPAVFAKPKNWKKYFKFLIGRT